MPRAAICTLPPPAGILACLLLLAPAARAQDELRLGGTPTLSFAPPPAAAPVPSTPEPPKAFGRKGSQWWTVGAGFAHSFDDVNDLNLPRVAWSVFLADDVEFSIELNGWFFNQPGDNAIGINPSMVFRWHFINSGPWTVYGDVGVGLLAATDNVPEGGTPFDFMPRIGVGFTRQLNDAGLRLQGGVRWHHISNARITGDFHNPGRDAPFIYAGLMWPF
jgi:lipid A 3-O-deacylase